MQGGYDGGGSLSKPLVIDKGGNTAQAEIPNIINL